MVKIGLIGETGFVYLREFRDVALDVVPWSRIVGFYMENGFFFRLFCEIHNMLLFLLWDLKKF